MFNYLLIMTLLASSFVFSFGQEKIARKLEKEKDINLCKVEKKPDQFIGKELDIKATFVSGFEMGWLENTNPCENQNEKRFAILYRFDENYRKTTEINVLRKFDKILKKDLKDSTNVHKIQGQFRVLISKYKKKNDYDTRYDYEFTVVKIISVVSEIQ